MDLIFDVYEERIIRDSLEYMEEFRDSIFKLIGTDDPEIWSDGQVKYMEEPSDTFGIRNYLIIYKDDEVGMIRSKIFEDGSFTFEEIVR